MIKELTGGNRRVVAFLKVEEHSALLAHMNEGGMANVYSTNRIDVALPKRTCFAH